MFHCSIVPPMIEHDAFSFSACGPKYIESMAMTSLMTGRSLDETGSRRCVDYLASCIEEDGLFYCKIGPDPPMGQYQPPEDWANIYGQGRMLRAMLAMHQLEGDDIWVDRMRRLTRTLEKIAVRKTDPANRRNTYAYFPTNARSTATSLVNPKSGWKTTEVLETKMPNPSNIGPSIGSPNFPDHTFGIPLYMLAASIEPLVQGDTLRYIPRP